MAELAYVDQNRRIITVDMLKGCAVVGLLFLHGLIYGVWHQADTALSVLPLWVIIFLVPIIIMATWGAGFALISGFINFFNSIRKMKKGLKRKEVLWPVVINSLIIILLDPLRCYFLIVPWKRIFTGEFGYSVALNMIVNGKFQWPPFEQIMSPGALPMIGIAGLCSVLILCFLYGKDGKRKNKINPLPILAGIGFIMILCGEPLSHSMYGLAKNMFYNGGLQKIAAYPLVLLGGDMLSFIPFGAFAFFGMAFAWLMVNGVSKKDLKKYTFAVSGIGYVFFIVFLLRMIFQLSDTGSIVNELFGYTIQPRALTFFNISSFMLITMAFLLRYEYSDHETYMKYARRTTWLRRYGMITLSLYMLDAPVNTALSKLFHSLFGNPSLPVDAFMTNLPAILLFLGVMVAVWYGLIRLWEKVGFKGGMETFVVWAGSKFRKERSNRLDVNKNLYLK